MSSPAHDLEIKTRMMHLRTRTQNTNQESAQATGKIK